MHLQIRVVAGAGLLLLVLTSLSQATAQKEEEKDKVRNPLAREPVAIAAGEKTFRERCALCHAIDGKGTARGSNLTRGTWAHGGRDSQIFETIRKGVPGTQMPPNDFPDAEVWQLVAYIRSLGGEGDQPPVPGNPARGEALFFGKARCASCHMIRGKGSPFGPELSIIGTARSAAAIRRSILEPDAEIADGFDGVRLKLKSGSAIEGVVRNEDNFSMQLMDREGRLRMLDKVEIAALERMEKKSLMPGNMAAQLTPEEFQDLLAFLDRQRKLEESSEESR